MSFPELQAAVVQAVSAPTPWWLTLATGGGVAALVAWIGKRVVGAFDTMGKKVDGFQSNLSDSVNVLHAALREKDAALATHAQEDLRNFKLVEERANDRHEALMTAVQRHADVAQDAVSSVELAFESVKQRLTGVEAILDRRSEPRPKKQ
jgi:hypothetical protein